jgi:hypothetical protein
MLHYSLASLSPYSNLLHHQSHNNKSHLNHIQITHQKQSIKENHIILPKLSPSSFYALRCRCLSIKSSISPPCNSKKINKPSNPIHPSIQIRQSLKTSQESTNQISETKSIPQFLPSKPSQASHSSPAILSNCGVVWK